MTDDELKAQDEGVQSYIHNHRLVVAVLRFMDSVPDAFQRGMRYQTYYRTRRAAELRNQKAKQ